MTRFVLATAFFIAAVPFPSPARAQGTVSDYQRAITLRERYQGLAIDVPEQVQWVRSTNRFWYRKSVPGGNAFVLVDADAQTRKPAFDHAKLADSLSAAMGTKYTPVTLPFTTFSFVDDDRAIEFTPGSPNQPPRATARAATCQAAPAGLRLARVSRRGKSASPVHA